MIRPTWHAQLLLDTICNYYTRPTVSYVTEPAQWVIHSEGQYLAQLLKANYDLTLRVTTSSVGLHSRVIHFGSLPAALGRFGITPRHAPSNTRIVTIFHIPEDTGALTILTKRLPFIDQIHTASQTTFKALVSHGIPAAKIAIIPLAVDTTLFFPRSGSEREALKKKLDLPADHLIVGSFQKDGVGWGKGDQPKLIKGPDILTEAVTALAKQYPVCVLLTGPSRGYVVRYFEQHRIPYRYLGYTRTLADIAPLYAALDVYMITSRLEGGPKQILEAWASQVPVVSTKVGLVPDIATHTHNAMLAHAPDTASVVAALTSLLDNPTSRNQIVQQAYHDVQQYSWSVLIDRYYSELYRPHL